MSYPTPEVGARQMYETVREHLKSLLGQTEGETSEMEKEHAQHETFLITRLGMGGSLAGGDEYLGEIDRHVLVERLEDGGDGEASRSKHLLLQGDAGMVYSLNLECRNSWLINSSILCSRYNHDSNNLQYNMEGYLERAFRCQYL